MWDPALPAPAPACRPDAPARRGAVRTYYDHCRNDYRILWRTDENGSIHFGFFAEDELRRPPAPIRGLHLAANVVIGLALTLLSGLLALTGTRWGRERAVRCLRLAVRGRAVRHDRAQRRMTDTCAGAVSLTDGDVVLDAGCGVGGTAVRLATCFGARVHGINVHLGHLREAQRRALAAAARVTVSAQDFTVMAVGSETVSVVWALESLCHAADKRAFLAEAFRVLRPGGRLMVADFFLADGRPDAALRIQAWTEGWALAGLAPVTQFAASLSEAGFRDVVYRDVARHVAPSSERLYKASRIVLPVHGLLQRLGLRSQVQAQNVMAAREQYTTLRDGAWTYGIFVARR